MNPVLVVVAAVVVGGAILAVSARTARAALLGLAIALVAAPALADPIPGTLPLAARILASVLAADLLWIAVRPQADRPIETPLGWPAEGLAAVAAALIGWGIGGATDGALGPEAAVAAAAALLVTSVRPIALGRDPLRIGIGLLLLVAGTMLARAGLLGSPGDFGRLVEAGLILAVGAGAAWRIRADEPVPAR